MAEFSPEKASPQLARRTLPAEQPEKRLLGDGPRRVWITGGSGFFGAQLLSEMEPRGWRVQCVPGRNPLPPGRHEVLDLRLSDESALVRAAREHRPDAVVHLAAMTSTAECEALPEEAFKTNVVLARNAAAAAEAAKAHFVYASTDLVFDGQGAPYAEEDRPNPLMVYGKTKLLGEEEARQVKTPWTICRCSLMYGPRARDHYSCLSWMLEGLVGGRGVTLFDDEFRSPADARWIAQAFCEVIERAEEGVFHLAGAERLSRLEFGRMVAKAWGLSEDLINVAKIEAGGFRAQRPADVSLKIDRAKAKLDYAPPTIEESLSDLYAMYPDGAL